jgi:hypothetical protein
MMLVVIGSALLGCSVPTERGWIGGDLTQVESARPIFAGPPRDRTIRALPRTVAAVQKRAVFVSSLNEDTPLADAGVREGDLIVSLKGKPVKSLTSFQRTIDASAPGTQLNLKTYRDDTYENRRITIGQETLDEKGHGYLALGLFIEMQADLFPDPNFNLLGLLGFQQWDDHIDLQSVEQEYVRRTEGIRDAKPSRGWSLYLGPVRIGHMRNIVEQRRAPGQPSANARP